MTLEQKRKEARVRHGRAFLTQIPVQRLTAPSTYLQALRDASITAGGTRGITNNFAILAWRKREGAQS